MTSKRNLLRVLFVLIIVLLISSSIATGQEDAGEPVATTNMGSSKIEWQPHVEYARLILTVAGPDGLELRKVFEAGTAPVFELVDENGTSLPDGQYNYELLVIPVLSSDALEALAAAGESADRDRVAEELRQAGEIPDTMSAQLGEFSVSDGALVAGDLVEGQLEAGGEGERNSLLDQVILDDLIVDGSLCVGLDCVNGESFGFTTLKLKENNLRILFEDTSSSASFPRRDWQLEANSSSNGGSSHFKILDCGDSSSGGSCGSPSSNVFTVEAGAGNNALFVDRLGNVGIGTDPVVDLHVKSGNTPTARLEQDGTSGFTPQTWDVAGNEANFFIRDVTNGSRLPFRIRPGAPTDSIMILANGHVGLGDASPDAALNLERSDGTAKILVEETNGTVASRYLMELINNGAPQFRFVNSANGNSWQFSMLPSNNFAISKIGTGGPEAEFLTDGRVRMGPGSDVVFDLAPSGNLSIDGTLTESVPRAGLRNSTELSGQNVLANLPNLSVYSYRYRSETGKLVQHLSPQAEEFYSAFGLGTDAKHISPKDIASVALIANQELHLLLQEQQAELAELQAKYAEQEQQIEELSQKMADFEASFEAD